LGNGNTTPRHVPGQVAGLSDVIAIAAGAGHNFALKNDATVWAWGYNIYGNLGDNTATHQSNPVRVQFPF
jgi:alpha-tubulin suppressor-like RCC1 family protein